MTDPVKTIADSLREEVERFTTNVTERLDPDPSVQERQPLSVFMLAPSCNPQASALQWITVLQMVEDDPSHAPGYGHALTLSRDLIGFLIQLNGEFALGLKLEELLANHPLYERVPRQTH